MDTNFRGICRSYLGPKVCMDFATEHMSATVLSDTPPSRADASFKFGVTISAIAKSSFLYYKVHGVKFVMLTQISALDRKR